MKHIRAPLLAFGELMVASSLLLAHDLFFKLERYFVEPHSHLRIPVFNGTFATSEAGVAPERLVELSLVSPMGRTRLPPDSWSTEATRAGLEVHVGEPGTYVVGASLHPRRIELTAEQFNAYLKEDGILDVLEARTRNNQLDRPARERYSKHVKAIFQVGERRTESYAAVLGYPAEIVPLTNPYLLHPGSELGVRCLVDGKPVANQVVLWGGESANGAIAQRATRTDGQGVASVRLDQPGKWYVKFVNMVPLAEPDFDYESKWATLTFEIR
jgi:hypothetical protein